MGYNSKLYSSQNESHLYTLLKHVHERKQETMNVTLYFNKLLIWQEMDLCREIVWNCPCEGVQYSNIEEVDHVYDFLAGLNSKFDLVRGRILH